jgi:signal transduction histidine kinase
VLAHEVRNPFAAVLGWTEEIKRISVLEEPFSLEHAKTILALVHKHASYIFSASKYIQEILANTLDYSSNEFHSRGTLPSNHIKEEGAFDLRVLFSEVETLLRYLTRPGVQFVAICPAGLAVCGSRLQWKQVGSRAPTVHTQSFTSVVLNRLFLCPDTTQPFIKCTQAYRERTG